MRSLRPFPRRTLLWGRWKRTGAVAGLLAGLLLRPEVTFGDEYMAGGLAIRGGLERLVEALMRADKKGPITGESVRAALETFKDFDTGGLTPDKITYTSTDHRPFMSVNIMEMEKGKLVLKKTMDLPRKAEWLGL